MPEPAAKREQTGSASLDRIQGAAREVLNFAKRTFARIAAFEASMLRTYGIGITRIQLHDDDITLTETDSRFLSGQIVFFGTLTAAKTINLPRATDATAYRRWLVNVTTGGFALTIKTKDGSISLPNGGHYAAWVSSTGPSAESAG